MAIVCLFYGFLPYATRSLRHAPNLRTYPLDVLYMCIWRRCVCGRLLAAVQLDTAQLLVARIAHHCCNPSPPGGAARRLGHQPLMSGTPNHHGSNAGNIRKRNTCCPLPPHEKTLSRLTLPHSDTLFKYAVATKLKTVPAVTPQKRQCMNNKSHLLVSSTQLSRRQHDAPGQHHATPQVAQVVEFARLVHHVRWMN